MVNISTRCKSCGNIIHIANVDERYLGQSSLQITCSSCGSMNYYIRNELTIISTTPDNVVPGAIIGGAIGAVLAGPLGAVIGGLLGAALGAGGDEAERRRRRGDNW